MTYQSTRGEQLDQGLPVAVRAGWNPLPTQQRQRAVLALEVAQLLQDVGVRPLQSVVDTRVPDHRSSGAGCAWPTQPGGPLAGNDSIAAPSAGSRNAAR